MGGVTTRNMYSSLQKYNELYIVASCWTIINVPLVLPQPQQLVTEPRFGTGISRLWSTNAVYDAENC